MLNTKLFDSKYVLRDLNSKYFNILIKAILTEFVHSLYTSIDYIHVLSFSIYSNIYTLIQF